MKERGSTGGRKPSLSDVGRRETALAESFVRGDEAAFGAAFEQYRPLLRKRALRGLPAHLGRKVSVADVLQEAQIVAHRRRHGFEYRGPGSLAAWLLAIVDLKIREVIRHHAGTAKRAVGREVDGVSRSRLTARGPSPSQQAIAHETEALMRRAREHLSPAQQEVLRLVQENGFTLREAAERMGRSRDSVKKIYGRGIVRFKELFEALRESDR